MAATPDVTALATLPNMDAAIRVVRLPVIEDRLRAVQASVEARVRAAAEAVCTEETIAETKAVRAALRKEFEGLEAQRKAVKAAIFAPYNNFEAVYRECVADAFQAADAVLKAKIDQTENEIKRRCEDGLRAYFAELCAAYDLPWLEFEMAGVKVDMASAKQKTPGKLRQKLSDFVRRVARDVEALSNMEHADELLAAYKGTLDVTTAIGIVEDYHRRVKAEEDARQARAAQREAETEAVRKVEALAPPTVGAAPKKLTVTFAVEDTRERLIALREWMKENHYQYK